MADQIRASKDALTAKIHRGDGAALLAFDYAEAEVADLAGFAIHWKGPGASGGWVMNRKSFTVPVTQDTQVRRWFPTDEAPIQKFRWTHFPPVVKRGRYRYTVTARLFSGAKLRDGPSVDLALDLLEDGHARFELGFTRGYVSSQGYAERFHNAPIRPAKKSLDFDTRPFEARWSWLGYHARRMLFDFLDACRKDPKVTVDLFAYDLDEPAFVKALESLGPRLRAFLDDSSRHVVATAIEPEARRRLEASAGAANVRTGHFQRFAHDKVLIQRRGGVPKRVLTGSANFSLRGLYVQSNSVIVIDDPEVVQRYAEAFDVAFANPKSPAKFEGAPIAKRWFPFRKPGLPDLQVSFAPHASAEVSLRQVADEIDGADSSVLYAVMELGGTGPVLEKLRALATSRDRYSYGITQSLSGDLAVDGGDGSRPSVVPFSFLEKTVPKPFRAEYSGGQGQVIHHKFVVLDFNDSDPVVFCGSSNLAKGGEEENGDNLLAIRDRTIATAYAVEAIRLIDHYRFRAVLQKATKAAPLLLEKKDGRWWQRFYRPGSLGETERRLFVR
jgi:hypothetical protein